MNVNEKPWGLPGSLVVVMIALLAMRDAPRLAAPPAPVPPTPGPRFVDVQGRAAEDDDFRGGGDRVRYALNVVDAEGPFQVTAELWYQPIGYRWAQNLDPYDTLETNRFVDYYDSMSDVSGVILATGATRVQ